MVESADELRLDPLTCLFTFTAMLQTTIVVVSSATTIAAIIERGASGRLNNLSDVISLSSTVIEMKTIGTHNRCISIGIAGTGMLSTLEFRIASRVPHFSRYSILRVVW